MTLQDELAWLPITDLSRRIRAKDVSPLELTRVYLQRIERLNTRFSVYLTVTAERALAAAAEAERSIAVGGYVGPLHGVPVAIKDTFMTDGIRTTAGSRLWADYVPTRDATVVTKLKAAGAIILGKTNTHEFGAGATNENPHYGSCRNPWNREHLAGGSSGGSAAAVAAGLAAAALGTDAGGSIRIPAAACGVFGLKPTFGRVSRHGQTPFAWSVDHAGPITRDAGDAALVLQALAGYDPLDPQSSTEAVPNFSSHLRMSLRGVRVGVPSDVTSSRVDPGVEAAFDDALQRFREGGADIVDIALPSFTLGTAVVTTIGISEAATFHEPFLRTRSKEYGSDVRVLLAAGLELDAVNYVRAMQVRQAIAREFLAALDMVDVIATPSLPMPAPRVGQKRVQFGDYAESVQNALLRFVCPVNLAGLPAASVPCGRTPVGLPIGLQLIGKAFEEPFLLGVAAAFERMSDRDAATHPAL